MESVVGLHRYLQLIFQHSARRYLPVSPKLQARTNFCLLSRPGGPERRSSSPRNRSHDT